MQGYSPRRPHPGLYFCHLLITVSESAAKLPFSCSLGLGDASFNTARARHGSLLLEEV